MTLVAAICLGQFAAAAGAATTAPTSSAPGSACRAPFSYWRVDWLAHPRRGARATVSGRRVTTARRCGRVTVRLGAGTSLVIPAGAHRAGREQVVAGGRAPSRA